MAITQRAVGSWADSNATTQTVTLPTHAAGDMLILRAVCKPFGAAIVCNTSGWNAVAAQNTNGSTANGVGVGSMAFRAFYKIATSAAETNPVVTWGTTSAPGAAVAASYQKAATEAWVTPVGDGGGDTTARTSQTSTIDTHVSVVANDLVDFYRAAADDSGVLTVPTITQTGVTYNTVTESPATALSTGTSNDLAIDGGYRTATAGPSSAAAVVTGTSTASEEHGAWMTRLRVNQQIDLGLIDANPALYAPSINAIQSVTLGLIDAAGALYAPTVAPVQSLTLPLLSGGASYSVTVLAASPVSYWRLGESTPGTGTATDQMAANNGTYAGSPASVTGGLTGDSDTAVSLDGSTQNITTASGSSLNLTSAFSIIAWCKRDTTGNNGLFEKTIGGNVNTSFSAFFTGAYLRGRVAKTGVGFTDIDIAWPTDNAWHMAAITYDGTNVRVSVDAGTQSASASISGIDGGSGASYIGSLGLSGGVPLYWFDGSLDEVAVFGSALSTATISAIYTAGTGAGGGTAVYAPVLVAGSAVLTVPLLDAAPALYAPTIAPVAVTLTIAVLDAVNAVYAPTITTTNTITVGLIDAPNALYAPTVNAIQSVTLALLDAAPALYAPTVTVSAAVVTLPTLYSGPFDPTVFDPDVFDTGPVLYALTVTQTAGVATVTLALLDSGPALYAPTVYQDVFVTVPLLDAARALYAPTITTGAVSITLTLLTSTSALYAPTLSGGNALVVPLLDSGPTLYAPTLLAEQTVVLGIIDSGRDLYDPSLSYDQLVVLPHLDAVRALYAPILVFAIPPLPRGVHVSSIVIAARTSAVIVPSNRVSTVVVPSHSTEVE